MLLTEVVSLGIKERVCDRCHESKPLHSFEITYSYQLQGKLHGYCLTCRILGLVERVGCIVNGKKP